MSKDYTQQLFTQIRRSDRQITDEGWIKAFLHRAAYGTLATSIDNQPFINTNLFVYDEPAQAIYLHGAKTGRTPANLAVNNRVCFSISEMGRLLPATEALEFSVEYDGVVIFGATTLVEDVAEKEHALQALLDKYFPHLQPGQDYRPIMPEELKRTAVYRLEIEQWSGKQKKVDGDFPGAFFYKDRPAANRSARKPATNTSNPTI